MTDTVSCRWFHRSRKLCSPGSVNHINWSQSLRRYDEHKLGLVKAISKSQDAAAASAGVKVKAVVKGPLGHTQTTGRIWEQDTLNPYEEFVKLDECSCTNITLVPGDRLYMPFGVLHRAVTGAEGSAHLTVQFIKDGISWSDLMLKALGYVRH